MLPNQQSGKIMLFTLFPESELEQQKKVNLINEPFRSFRLRLCSALTFIPVFSHFPGVHFVLLRRNKVKLIF